jgi:maleylacetate reductase
MNMIPRDFVYTAQPSRVVFGRGSLRRLVDEVNALGAKKVLVLCTPEQRQQAQVAEELLGSLCVGIYDGAQMHVPIEGARKARAFAASQGADCMVAIGGGSTIGLGKAIALESTIPIIAVPTTYAGSEMTPIYGITENNLKKTGRDLRVLPKTVLYDPELSSTLPVRMSIVSGMNAIAHAAEGLYAKDGNPVMSLMAEEGIRALARGMRGVHANAANEEARNDCLYGAWLCGSVLGHVGMAIHHKLCHTLGGTFSLPHAETHTVVLPHALAYNSKAVPQAMQRVARAIGSDSAATGLFDLATELGAPTALKNIGMKKEDIEIAVQVALSNPYWNPEPIVEASIRTLLQNAWEGRRPGA